MPLLDREQRCLDFINGRLDDPITEEHLKGFQVAFRSWKFCFDIYDTDLYHRIAQGLEIRELSRFGCIHYLFDVPTEGGLSDHWNANLSGDRDSEFLKKYGKHYKMVDE
jgi:hypothetical protein